MDKDKIEIVVYEDYDEIYAHFSQDPKEAEDKIKRGMMKKIGFSDAQIDSLIDTYILKYDGLKAFEDNPYTPVKLVKVFEKDPPEGDPIPPPVPEDEKKDPAQSPRQIMLQQYYGDKEAEANRRKKFARFKSHIVQKPIKTYDKDGKSTTIQVYTVEDYPEKETDTDELLLSGYATRLERLSRAHQGDFSPYEAEYVRMIDEAKAEIYMKYYEKYYDDPSHAEEFRKETLNAIGNLLSEDVIRKAIQVLIDRDTDFIETNNYGYNSHQNTQENLRTLGKFGEKSVKAPISVEQSVATKFGLHCMNALIEIRNHTTAPINQAIGTYIASPIHRLFTGTKRVNSQPVNVNGYLITPMKDMIETSQKNSVGMFKNKRTHRYQARKDYFTQFISKEEQERLISTEKGYDKKSVKRTTLRTNIKLAILPRILAVLHYKEGNIAVLNAGLHDIEIATDKRNEELRLKRDSIITLKTRINSRKKEIDELEKVLSVAKDTAMIAQIQQAIEIRKTQVAILTGKFIERSRVEIDSIQTDALSMSQHDKVNKSNVTIGMKIIKAFGRAVAGAYISQNLYREVSHQVKTPDTQKYIPGTTRTIPGKTIYKEETVEKTIQVPETIIEPGLDKEGVANITLDSIYSQGSGKLYYSVYGGQSGRTIEDKTNCFRGIEFTYNGQSFSGSDGHGFDATVLTTVQLTEDINGNTKIVDVVQDVLQNALGKNFTKDEVEQLILEGSISDIDLWRSDLDTGIPLGWLQASEIIPDMIDSGSHEVTRMVDKVVEETVKKAVELPGHIEKTEGHWELYPGQITEYVTEEINPAIAASLTGLCGLEIADWNDLFRFTRSIESIQDRAPQHLEAMASENKEKIKAKNKAKNNDVIDEDKKNAKKRKIKKPFQKNNKPKLRYFGHISDRMKERTKQLSEKQENVTVFERFFGTKTEDIEKSGYNENAIGTNEQDTTNDIKLEEPEEEYL